MISYLPSCQVEDGKNSHFGAQEVGIYAGNVQTRTEMLSDGLGTVWVAGDELALWAVGESGDHVLSNQKFKTYGLDGRRGFFTSTLSSQMPDGTYTYYCSYPVPVSTDGLTASFSLPSVQDGKVSSGADIMIANPVVHGPLKAVPEIEDHSGMSMEMNRMLHQFRFFIPEDDAVLGDQQIQKIVLTFPESVCGILTYNLADISQKPVITEPGNEITLNLDKSFLPSSESTGKYDFACVSVAPFKAAQGQSLNVKAYTKDKIAKLDPIDLCARTFEAGHSTPVRFVVKELADFPYVIKFTLTANNVGENVTSIKFVAPSGCRWPVSGTNEYVYQTGKEILAGEVVDFKFPDYEDYAKFSNASITIELETENTISTSNVSVGSIPSGVESHTSQISATVPYLLYQDFSSIPDFSDGHDNPKTGTGSDTWVGMNELSSFTSALTDWYGARVGGKSGTAVRLCCRYQNVVKGAYYKGQLYAPAITRIKEGHSVKVNVSFRYGGGSTTSKAKSLMYFGINTLNPIVNPDDTDLTGGVITGTGYGNQYPATLLPVLIEKKELSRGSDYSFEGTASVNINDFDNFMRLTWFVTSTHSALFTNSNSWLFLDDIKVQIVK